MKTVVIGDIHGLTIWKKIVSQENDADRIIFMGDYFDSFNIKGIDQYINFLDILEFKKNTQKEVILLIGNHDYHYFPEIGNVKTSGYQPVFSYQYGSAISENRNMLQMAYQFDNYLFSHAGISTAFLDNALGKNNWNYETLVDQINELFLYKPLKFNFGEVADKEKVNYYLSPYGDNVDQSPIWIRPRSLMLANRNTLRKKVIQIVGHTAMEKIDLKSNQKTTGGRYFFIDTLSTSGEYLIIQDNRISVGKTG